MLLLYRNTLSEPSEPPSQPFCNQYSGSEDFETSRDHHSSVTQLASSKHNVNQDEQTQSSGKGLELIQ
jgi:hypothetical protein